MPLSIGRQAISCKGCSESSFHQRPLRKALCGSLREGGELPSALVACVGTARQPFQNLDLPIYGKDLACARKGWQPRVCPLYNLLRQQHVDHGQHQLVKATVHTLGFLRLAGMCSGSAAGCCPPQGAPPPRPPQLICDTGSGRASYPIQYSFS